MHPRRGEVTIIQNVQIAVADDDRQSRDFVVNVMTYSVNREVITFERADDIITFLSRGNHLNLLLINLALPKKNPCLHLLKTIKQNYPHIYLIAMSGDPADQIPVEDLGVDAFLSKPFALRDLFKIVQQFVVCNTSQ